MIEGDGFLIAAVRVHDPQIKILVSSEPVESNFMVLFTPGQMAAVFGDDCYAGHVFFGLRQDGWRLVLSLNACNNQDDEKC